MKYIRKFKSISSATSATDLVSPNVSNVEENEQTKLLMIDCGNDVPVKITGSSLNNLAIQKKTDGPADNEIWYKTANNNEKIYDFNEAIEIMSEEIGEYTGPSLISNILDGDWYKAKFSSNLTSLGIEFSYDEQTEEETYNFNAPIFISIMLNDEEGFVTEIKLPDCITTLNMYSFYENNLVNVNTPNNLINIGYLAYAYCPALASIHISGNVSNIDQNAFGGLYSLTAFTVDNENNYYSEIDGILFNYSKTNLFKYPAGSIRTEYSIPNSIVDINIQAFYGAMTLTSIIMPTSLSTIGYSAFVECENISSITCYAITPPVAGQLCFDNGMSKSIPVYVPSGSISAYQAANEWREFTNFQPIAE